MSKLGYELAFLIIVIACFIISGKIENHNGRIQQCNDIGWKYLKNIGCVSSEDYYLQYNQTNMIINNNITTQYINEMT